MTIADLSLKPESLTVEQGDRVTIRQVTDRPSIHHHPFFFVDAWDAAMSFLLLMSNRTAAPQIYIERAPGAELIRLTNEPNLAEWSVIPSKDGRWVYCMAGQEGGRLSLRDGTVETLVHFDSTEMREAGMVGAAMGTTARWPAGATGGVPVKTGPASRFWMIDTEAQKADFFLEAPIIGHPQFCPDDKDLILCAGPMTDRVRVTDRAGHNRRTFQREHDSQWIMHEAWRPGHRTVLFVDWPTGFGEIDPDTGAFTTITDFPVWHGAPDATGRKLVCDTNFPDRGLHVLDLSGTAAPMLSTPTELSPEVPK